MKSVVFSDADAGMTGYFTILYCLRNCSFCFPGSRLAMYQGDLILAPEAFVYKTSSRGSLISLTFREAFFTEDLRKELKDCTVLSRFLSGEVWQPIFFRAEENPVLADWTTLLKAEAVRDQDHHERIMKVLMLGFFMTIDSCVPAEIEPSSAFLESNTRFAEILDYMKENYATATLEDTAARFGYNPNYLSTRFRTVTGKTFKQKLLSMRLDEAEHLLTTTDLKIDEISTRIGFHDKSYFMKKFHEQYQMTPARYRRLQKKKAAKETSAEKSEKGRTE